jgi:MYXO-CTERM domain-containing protein
MRSSGHRLLRLHHLGAVGLACAALIAAPPRASAYVRTLAVAKDGSTVPVAWSESCLFFTAYPADFVAAPVSHMSLDDVEQAVDGAANAWSMASESCTYLSFSLTFAAEPTPVVGPSEQKDLKNWIVFRGSSWCPLEDDGTCTKDPVVLAASVFVPEALAVTTVSANTKTGEIRDVDIQVNAYNHSWADLVTHPELFTSDPTRSIQDLQNALTHEMGHAIGLDHTCYHAGAKTIPVDQNGDSIPECDAALADVQATTMYPSADPGDTAKRTLAPDDRQGLCDIYPVAKDPMICRPVTPVGSSGCSCAAAPGGGQPAAPAVSAALIAVGAAAALQRRRRRRSARG